MTDKKVNYISDEKGEKLPPTFISLVMHLYGGKGHELSYQTAVGEAVRLNGWDYLAAISPDPVLKKFPREWRIEFVDSGVLDYQKVEIKKLLRRFRFGQFIKSMYIFSVALSGLLKKEIKERPNKKIIFLETFNPLQLLSLVFALFFVRRGRIAVWLLYRGGPNWGGPRYRLMARSFSIMFRATNPVLELLVGKQNLRLFTDSDMLRSSLPEYYKRPVHLLPIPHTPALAIEVTSPQRSEGKEIVCWWPGTPRADKGLDVIQRLALLKNIEAHKIKLVVANSANLTADPEGVRIEAIENKLDRTEYDRRFFCSDLILLPYDQGIYNESTSGIFVECIVAGAIPLVTPGTWMAYELGKYDLSELVIDWDDKGIIQAIIKISGDVVIREKINKMHHDYKKYHNVPHFAEVLNSLYRKFN